MRLGTFQHFEELFLSSFRGSGRESSRQVKVGMSAFFILLDFLNFCTLSYRFIEALEESSRRVKVGMRVGARTERKAARGFPSMIGKW